MKKAQLRTRMHGLYRMPDDPFEAYDENGRPCLPLTIDDDSPSPGTPPGSFKTLKNAPGSGVDPNTGKMMARRSADMLAAELNWAVAETAHPQKTVRIGDGDVEVDRDIAHLIRLLNAAGMKTVASCRGDESFWAYVTFADVPSAQRFLRCWYRDMLPRGYSLPTLDLDLRDAHWREEVGGDSPFPQQVEQDASGFSYTVIWKLYHDKLEKLMPVLLTTLKRELHDSA